MKLEDIIKAIRENTIKENLGRSLKNEKPKNILLYCEYSISADGNYIFQNAEESFKPIIKLNTINFERLCSLHELDYLINYFVTRLNRKSNEILVIDIIDFLDKKSLEERQKIR